MLANLLRSEAGLEILEALLGEARPHWWASFKRRVTMEQIHQRQVALRKEIEALDEERANAANAHR